MMNPNSDLRLQETEINIISERTRIEGKILLDSVTRIHGVIKGQVTATEGSIVVLSVTGIIEGDIHADTLMIDGFVKGDIHANTRVVLSGTGRVVGNIFSPSLLIEFGAYFEGRSVMENPNLIAHSPGSSTGRGASPDLGSTH